MRQLSPLVRIELRHHLRSIDTTVEAVIRALDPLHGMLVMTDDQFNMQLYDLIGALERLKVDDKVHVSRDT